tara:strand:+ start:112 stop:1272 length:1161 start_codon:yes stop_codon:yes gene_type:complete
MEKEKNLTYNPDIIDSPILIQKKTTEKTNESDIIEINDIRNNQDFKGITFSNFKKQEVKQKLLDNIHNQHIEPACYWCAELICSGHFGELWELLITYISKHIHIGNPKIIIYLEMRYNTFRNIMNQDCVLSDLDARNNEKIRKLFAEIICTISTSIKKPGFEQIKIKSSNEFDMTQLSSKLKAPNDQYIHNVFKNKDPKELFIAMNELAYSVSNDGKNMLNACYWIEWTLEFESICKKRKTVIKCESRNYKVDNKYRTNAIWLIWDVLIESKENNKNDLINKTINSLKKLFCIKYTEACGKRRRYLLYFAVALLTENISNNSELVINRDLLYNVTSKIETIYKQIKKNEIAPKTEYLFNGINKRKAVERSLKQLETVNSIIDNGNN